MEERVTDALFDVMEGTLRLHDARRLARAAISVMYKPTTEMLREAGVVVAGTAEAHAAVWETMIDAASPGGG